jgi:hypothetical protein
MSVIALASRGLRPCELYPSTAIEIPTTGVTFKTIKTTILVFALNSHPQMRTMITFGSKLAQFRVPTRNFEERQN